MILVLFDDSFKVSAMFVSRSHAIKESMESL